MKNIRISLYQTVLIFCTTGIIFSTVFLINNLKETSELRQKLTLIQNEINLKEVIYQNRIKEYEVLEKKHKQQTDKLKLDYKLDLYKSTLDKILSRYLMIYDQTKVFDTLIIRINELIESIKKSKFI